MIFIVEDTIITFVKLPGAITYSLSGGKITHLTTNTCPHDVHPSAQAKMIHVGTSQLLCQN